MVPDTPSDAPLPASLILRVAEAADGIRDGQPHWFLVARERPHELTPFDSEGAAQAGLKKKKPASNYLVMGPYVAGPSPVARARRKKKKKIRSIQIHYEGSKKPVEIDPRADAIFLTAAALDKFAYPYYARVRGVAEAATMRAEQLEDEDDPPPVIHFPWTEYE